MVDGPFAGRHFKPGVPYAEIPPTEKSKFTKLKDEKAGKRKSSPNSKMRRQAKKVKGKEPADIWRPENK